MKLKDNRLNFFRQTSMILGNPAIAIIVGINVGYILQGGPKNNCCKRGEIAPIAFSYFTPITHLFSAIFRDPITLFRTGRGPPSTRKEQNILQQLSIFSGKKTSQQIGG